jgi:hypothetical protein
MESIENTPTRNNDFKTPPPHRPLKVYAFDPTRGRTLGNYMTINTPYERLQPGPVGKYLEVIDHDANNKCYYQPVNLDDPWVILGDGLDPSESNPQFHQQMVYAVASETIARFESALGRSIKWSFGRWKRADREEEEEGEGGEEENNSLAKLRIFPHGMQDANAYYSDDLGALVFGYFPASEADSGRNLPGQTVFTCLSHDIIAHETAHALVDSQKDFFMEPTSADSLAFHEAFADIVALFQHFLFKEPLQEMIRLTGGQIFRDIVAPENLPSKNGPVFQAELTTDNPLVALAVQFGEAMGMRKALRSALGTPPNSKDLEKYFEPHKRGSILVAAVFDAFFSIYVRRTSDLMRIARAGGMAGGGLSDDLHPDLVNRLAETATKTATHFLNICIRALDYCPPVDILFGDFLRAMITSDHALFPDDRYGYRAALIDAFRSRGIVPENVSSYSEESLLWCPPEVTDTGDDEDDDHNPLRCEGLQFDVFNTEDKEYVKALQKKNAIILHQFAVKNAEKLDLSTDPDLKIWVGSFHEMHRMSDDGKLMFDIVVEFTQRREKVPLDPADPNSPTFTFRGGTTLILDQNGWVRYAIKKSIGDKKDDDKNIRLKRQRDYLLMRQSEMGLAPYTDERTVFERAMKADFGLIHRGYY